MDIEKLAREAGLAGTNAPAEFFMRRLERFAALVVEECRKTCLSVSEDANEAAQQPDVAHLDKFAYSDGYCDACVDCDEALRSLIKPSRAEAQSPD